MIEKKRKAKYLTTVINETKEKIDEIKGQLQIVNETNDFEQEKTLTGEIIIDEKEYKLLCQLRSAKDRSREYYEHFQNIKSDIVYCEKLVKQCRKKMLAEFEVWYTESFPVKDHQHEGVQEETSKQLNKITFQPKEDNGVKFDLMQQQLLMNNPNSVAFYNARIQTERRKLYENNKKQPGSVTPSVRNALPKTMLIQ